MRCDRGWLSSMPVGTEHGLPSLAPETMGYVIDSEPFLQLRRASQCGAISATAKGWDQDREAEFISFLCHLLKTSVRVKTASACHFPAG